MGMRWQLNPALGFELIDPNVFTGILQIAPLTTRPTLINGLDPPLKSLCRDRKACQERIEANLDLCRGSASSQRITAELLKGLKVNDRRRVCRGRVKLRQ